MSDFKYVIIGVLLGIVAIFSSLELSHYFKGAIVKSETIVHKATSTPSVGVATSTASTSAELQIPENWIADESSKLGLAFAYPADWGDIKEETEECLMDTKEQLEKEQKEHPEEPCRKVSFIANDKTFLVSQTPLYTKHPAEHDTYFGDLSSRVHDEISVRNYCSEYSANIDSCEVFKNKNGIFIAHSTERIGEEKETSSLYHIYAPSNFYQGAVFNLSLLDKSQVQDFLDVLKYTEPTKEYKKMKPSIKPIPEDYTTQGVYHDDVCGFEFQYPPKLAEDPLNKNVFFIEDGQEDKPTMILYTRNSGEGAHATSTAPAIERYISTSTATTTFNAETFSPSGRFDVLKSTKLTEYDKAVYLDTLKDKSGYYEGVTRVSLPCTESNETDLIIGYGKDAYFKTKKQMDSFVGDLLGTIFLFEPLTAADEADYNVLYTEGKHEINIYLFNEIRDEDDNITNVMQGCVYPVVRYVPNGTERSTEELRDVLKVLIKGTTRRERRDGYQACLARTETFGYTNKDILDINKWNLTIEDDGSVTVNVPQQNPTFATSLWCAGGATHSFMLRSAVINTLKQFPDIPNVILKSGGKTCSELSSQSQ